MQAMSSQICSEALRGPSLSGQIRWSFEQMQVGLGGLK